jgi:hypothetical protein
VVQDFGLTVFVMRHAGTQVPDWAYFWGYYFDSGFVLSSEFGSPGEA